MDVKLKIISEKLRFYKIISKIIKIMKNKLISLQTVFFETLFMYDTFKVIYLLIYLLYLEKANRMQQLDNVFGKCWAVANIKNINLDLADLRAFNPITSSTSPKILGKWCCLWNSYLLGLFTYYDFSVVQRTNIAQE